MDQNFDMSLAAPPSGGPAVLHVESIYGFYHGQDPRTFSPDAECCSEKELEAHKAACEAAGRGEWFRDDSGCSCPRPGVKLLKSSFGLGVYHVVMTAAGDYVRDASFEDYLRAEEWTEPQQGEAHSPEGEGASNTALSD